MGVGNEELEIQGPEEMCEGHTLSDNGGWELRP